MSGPIGVVSHKIILKAGLLLMAGRIDLHRVNATVDPSAPVTVIDPQAASFVKVPAVPAGPQALSRRHVIGLDHAELQLRSVVVRSTPLPTQLVIGADLLREMIIGFDFRRGALRVFDHAEYRQAGSGMSGAAIDTDQQDQCLHIDARGPSGSIVRLSLVGQPMQTPKQSGTIAVTVGGVPINAAPTARGTGICPDGDAIISWEAFADYRVTFDLAHGQLWIAQ